MDTQTNDPSLAAVLALLSSRNKIHEVDTRKTTYMSKPCEASDTDE